MVAAGLLALGSLTANADTMNVTADVTGTETWYATNTYVLQTVIYVQSNAVLTIEPGTVIKGATNVTVARTGIPDLVSALWVCRGGKLYATGTVDKPIIFTADGDDVNNPNDMPYDAMGLWGGVVLCGNGQLNSIPSDSPKFGTAAPFVDRFEGTDDDGPNGEQLYGGTNDADSSGALRYVSIRYPGHQFTTGKELNGLTMAAVGSGTEIEYVEVLNSQDDGFEWWGGVVNTKHLIAAFCDDDDFDTDAGYRGTNQFWFGIKPTWTGSSDSRGFETDGDYNQAAFNEAPISRWYVYNATMIGRGKSEATSSRKTAWSPRDEPAANVINSIFTEWDSGIRMENDALYHYTNNPALGNALNNIWNIVNNTDSATPGNGAFLFSDGARMNTIADPMLGGVSYTNNLGLDPRPQAGSPALSGALAGAPVPVSYRGAFAPNDDWADGWTAISALGYYANSMVLPEPTPPNLTTETSGGGLSVSILSQYGYRYQLQVTGSLTDPVVWTDIGDAQWGTGEALIFPTGGTDGTKSFFRVVTQ